MKTIGYAAQSPTSALSPFHFERRAPRDEDIAFDVLYTGICHSDLHQARNDWGFSTYPIVPGHEVVGRVTQVGAKVTRYKVGDLVGVGCMVDSCRACDQCQKGEEQLCREGNIQTYNGQDRHTGAPTYGGYAKHFIVAQDFALRIPANLELWRVAPLLCAGITTYSPLRTWNVKKGTRVGVIGLGGLGHMAVKLAVGMGALVTVISRTDAKQADARALGAHHVVASSDKAQMQRAHDSLDLIIDTVPIKHDVTPYLSLLDIDGTLVLVGQLGPLEEMSSLPLLMGRRRVAGSPIGGIAQTQEMLDFCGKKNILPDCEKVSMPEINEAFERLERADVRYRFVIDMATLQPEG